MKLSIEINLDDTAFDLSNKEVGAILADLGYLLENYPLLDEKFNGSIVDVNGNYVGTWKVEED